MSDLPEITHLQFLILGALRQQEAAGRDLRELLQQKQAARSGPAFYQMMARLEDAGLVHGEYRQQSIGGQTIKERHYRIQPAGERAWQATRDFYLGSIPAADLRSATRRA